MEWYIQHVLPCSSISSYHCNHIPKVTREDYHSSESVDFWRLVVHGSKEGAARLFRQILGREKLGIVKLCFENFTLKWETGKYYVNGYNTSNS